MSMLKKYHPIWLNTHFNHPKEIHSGRTAGLRELADAEGIPLGNQSVLLAGRKQQSRNHEEACLGAGEDPGAALLHLPVRSVHGHRAFPHLKVSKGLEIMEALQEYIPASAHLRGGRSRRGGKTRSLCPGI